MRTPIRFTALALLALSVACTAAEPAADTAAPTSAFAAFVDRYLDGFAMRHPSIAGGNGLHDHDDRLDDFSASAIAAAVLALAVVAPRRARSWGEALMADAATGVDRSRPAPAAGPR